MSLVTQQERWILSLSFFDKQERWIPFFFEKEERWILDSNTREIINFTI